jgi:competence protein ComEA
MPSFRYHFPVLTVWTRGDQWWIGVTTLGCILGIGIWCWKQGGIVSPSRGEAVATPRPVRFQLDVETATWPELTLISGIGETLARRIIERRDQFGTLTRQGLADVHGIGDAKLAALLRHLTVATGKRPTAEYD